MNALDLTILTTFNVLWPKEKQTEEKSVKIFWANSRYKRHCFYVGVPFQKPGFYEWIIFEWDRLRWDLRD